MLYVNFRHLNKNWGIYKGIMYFKITVHKASADTPSSSWTLCSAVRNPPPPLYTFCMTQYQWFVARTYETLACEVYYFYFMNNYCFSIRATYKHVLGEQFHLDIYVWVLLGMTGVEVCDTDTGGHLCALSVYFSRHSLSEHSAVFRTSGWRATISPWTF